MRSSDSLIRAARCVSFDSSQLGRQDDGEQGPGSPQAAGRALGVELAGLRRLEKAAPRRGEGPSGIRVSFTRAAASASLTWWGQMSKSLPSTTGVARLSNGQEGKGAIMVFVRGGIGKSWLKRNPVGVSS